VSASTAGARPLLRSELDALPAYRPGRPVSGSDQSGKLSANENPHGPLPAVRAAIAAAAATANRYPDPAASSVVTALADHHRVDQERVAVGAGSVALCQQLVQIAAGPGDEVLYAWRSFEAYPVVTRLAGARSRQVVLTQDGEHDLQGMLAALTDRTRVIFVCNPNNPTGRQVEAAELERFVDAVPERTLVVIDEAYREYARGVESDALALAEDRPNVCALRTFSKAYGLAGLRVGYAIASPQVTAALRKTTTPFAVTDVAQAAAVAALAGQDELEHRVQETLAERQRVAEQLTEQGWPVLPSQANFLWISDDGHADALVDAAHRAGVAVRAFPSEGVRITIGAPATNDRVIAAAVASR
jgi:histidinol-phosphate aminotransferase